MSKPHGPPGLLGILFKGLLSAVFAAFLGLLAWLTLYGGFDSLRDMRQLERTPRSLAAAVLPGEVTLEGRAESAGRMLKGPDSGKPTLYYSYTVERKRRDKDGKTKWETVESREAHVPFRLVDDSGEIRIETAGNVDFEAPQRHSRTQGDMRYSERRIDPGNRVFVFGYATAVRRGELAVRFDQQGQYSPIVSTDGAQSAHAGMSGATLFMLWLGLGFISGAIYFLLWALRVHQSTTYLATLSFAMAGALLLLSVQAARDDLRASFQRAARDVESARKAIDERLASVGVNWDQQWATLGEPGMPGYEQLDDTQRGLLLHLRDRLALQLERTAAIRRQWPERLVAGGLGLADLPAIPRSAHAAPPPPDEADGAFFAWIVAPVMLGLALLFGVLGFRRIRLKRTIENLATSRTAGVAYGLVELRAVAAADEGAPSLVGPLSERECVWYHYVVQQRRGSGKNAKWVTITDRREDRRFCLVDSEGRLPVDPAGAEAIVSCRKSRRDGNMRYEERWIEPGTLVYALGSALVDPRTEASLLLCRGPQAQPFLLSDLPESELLLKKARSSFLMLNFGANAGNATALALLGATAALDGAGFLAAALVPLALFAAFLGIVMYNDLVTLRQRVRLAWSNIEVSLMKRADLVPQLESVLRAYLAHEAGLQQDLARMRALASQSALDTQAAGQLVGAEQHVMARMVGLQEAYPELKSSELAMQLSATLVRLDNEVALMREGYNNAVERYNSRCQHFPELLFARAFAFRPADPFQASMVVHAVPRLAAEPIAA